ncbi:hypothetical protein ABIE93_005985 [Bradyrhizobium elkanii]|uniref:hypothetical protein n=1 Tax=Bradyrhizobium elkanii TaxID=29448 RepID=UPI003518B548
MIKQRIMYVCSECAEGCPEACGHYDRTELRVMPDGAWLCESCFDNNDDNEFLSWGHLPAPEEYGRIPASAQDAPDADIDKLRSVFEAAYGLCHGYDWNNGTAAKACGYRRKLLSAVNAIRPVPDFEGKYASPMTEGERGRETWRPIESAYKQSGKHLRMFGDGADFAKCEFIGMWWGCEWREAYSRQSVYPTHWMPLNPSPSPLSTDRLDLAFAEHRAAIDSVIDPDGAFQAGVTAAMEVVGEMRQSEAGLFDAAHSGQRGEDRSTALYDAYHAIRKALSLSSTQSEGSR